MTKYTQGKSAEYEARDICKEMGATAVTVSAGSRGPFDVIAFFPDRVLALQVKKSRSKNPSYDEELAEIRDIVVSPDVHKELWCRLRGGAWTKTKA